MLCVCLRLYLANFSQNNTAYSRNKAVQNVANVKIEKIALLRRQIIFIKPSPPVVMTTT